jgi:hypothetical protein
LTTLTEKGISKGAVGVRVAVTNMSGSLSGALVSWAAAQKVQTESMGPVQSDRRARFVNEVPLFIRQNIFITQTVDRWQVFTSKLPKKLAANGMCQPT